MAAVYPSAIKGSATYPWTSITDGITYPTAAQINDVYNEVTAIEEELGTDPAGSESTVKERIAALETGTLVPGEYRVFNINSVEPDDSNPPTSDLVTNGTGQIKIPVMKFPYTSDAAVYFSFAIPNDCDTGEDITMLLDCMTITTAVSATVDTIKLELWYSVVNLSTDKVSLTEYSSEKSVDLTGWDVKEPNRITDLVFDSANLTDNYLVFAKVMRDVSDETSDQYTDDIAILNIALRYKNKSQS